MFVVPRETLDGPSYVINFPTKKHWRGRSRLTDISKGLDDLVRVIRDLGIRSVAVPPLGTGNGGLSWRDVEPRIRAAFEKLPDVDVHLFSPSNAVRSLAPRALGMTWGRAAILLLMDAYVYRRRAQEPWEDPTGVSHLEIQKLMYFADIVEPRLNLRFAPGRYGPYSDVVRHQLQDMEGAFLQGLGDGSALALNLDPLTPLPGAVEAAAKFEGPAGPIQETIVEPVMHIIEGFEAPYGVELLASTHWVVDREDAADPDAAAKAVRHWTNRKSKIFTNHHVATAFDHLREVDAVGAG
jgi:O-acetyl-ADP-ribose deacetylase (regulator of RNase III)